MDKNIESVAQNLKDAGCTNEQIKEILNLYKTDKRKMCTELEKHREKLVKNMNKSGKQIDCLDYLIYKIKNEKERR